MEADSAANKGKGNQKEKSKNKKQPKKNQNTGTGTALKGQGHCKPGAGGGQAEKRKGQQQTSVPKNVENKATPKPKQANPKGPTPEVNQKEEIFQAVLLADNFSFSIFGPDCPLRQEV